MNTRTDKTTSTAVANTQQEKEAPFFQKPGSDGFFAKAATPPPFIQKQPEKKDEPPQSLKNLQNTAFAKMMSEWSASNAIAEPLARQAASDFVKNRKPLSAGVPGSSMLATPYGSDKLVPPRLPPDENRVFFAIMSRLNFEAVAANKKIESWTFEWYKPMRKKNAEDIAGDAAKFAADEVIDLSGRLIDAAVEFTVKAASKGGLKVMASFIPVVGTVIATAMTIYDVIELVAGLDDTVEVELNPYQKETDQIVADVKAFLQQREVASEKKYQDEKLPVQKPDALSVKQPHVEVPTSVPNKYGKLVVGE